MFRSDTVLGGAFALLGAMLVVAAWPIKPLAHIAYGPGLFPTIVGAGMILFGAEVVWSSRRRRPHAVSDEDGAADAHSDAAAARDASGPIAVAAFLIAPVLFIVLVPWLGFLIAMPLIMGGLIGILSRRWISAFLFGIIITLVLYGLFVGLLRVPLPWGLLEPFSGVLTWR